MEPQGKNEDQGTLSYTKKGLNIVSVNRVSLLSSDIVHCV